MSEITELCRNNCPSFNFELPDIDRKTAKTIYDVASVIIFPLGLLRLAAWGTRKTLNYIAAPFFMPSYTDSEEERERFDIIRKRAISDHSHRYNFKQRYVTSTDNVTIDTMTVWPKRLKKINTTILFTQGHRGNMALLLDHPLLYQMLDIFKARAVLYDSRGTGRSSLVMPTRQGILDDAEAVFNYAEKKFKETKVWIEIGHSFGGAINNALGHIFTKGKVAVINIFSFNKTSSIVKEKKNWFFALLAKAADWELDSIGGAIKRRYHQLVIYSDLDPVIPKRAQLAEALSGLDLHRITVKQFKGNEYQKSSKDLHPDKELHKRTFREDEVQYIYNFVKRKLRLN